ncbi:MAG: methyltransferase domain-containing protein [Saprospiraceae bacterium]|nr:methyltransferase domain-containing protein [Saprospiraceae bacterium]
MKFFIVEALKNFRTSGTVTPSSKHLVRTCLKKIDWNQTVFVLELGTGNGCITDEILKIGHGHVKVVSLEINEVFYNYSKEKYSGDKRLTMLNESAFKLREIVKNNNFGKPDIIISSLPLTLFKDEEIVELLEIVYDILDDKGTFIQYQYSPVTLKFIKKIFPKVKYELVLRNIPPAIVYRAHKS